MAEKNQARPNVVYLITHDQGTAASCYKGFGHDATPDLSTPNIDSFAARGVVMSAHFGTCPLCSPARGSLMTSRPPHMNGLVGLIHRGFSYAPGQKTVVTHFRDAGYRTMLVGFQHESADPLELGYEEARATKMIPRCILLTDDLDEALGELSAGERPFWLTIGTEDVHLDWTTRGTPVDPAMVEVPAYLPDVPEIRKDRAAFVGALKSYDDFVGMVREMLEKYSLLDNTIVVITTDHGIGHPRAKATLYDPGIQTLMIWSWPEDLATGAVAHQLVSGVDFAPTICDLCEVPPHPNFKGQSYAAVLRHPSSNQDINETVFAETTYHDKYNPMRAVRSKRFKLIRNYEPQISLVATMNSDIRRTNSFEAWKATVPDVPRAPEEFYDLVADPLEQVNLAPTRPDHPEFIRLRAILQTYLEETGDLILKGPYPVPDGARVSNKDDFDHTRHLKWVPKDPYLGR